MLDTTILVAGTVWPRWPYEVLQHAFNRNFTPVLSQYVMNETREKIHEKFPAYLPAFTHFLDKCPFEIIPEPTEQEIQENISLMSDKEDLPIALAAINADVDCLVSEDKHFTDNENLQQKIDVTLSGTFLRTYMGWTSDQLEAIRHRTWKDMVQRKAA
jgi:predicted nucleic acid-binding protein